MPGQDHRHRAELDRLSRAGDPAEELQRVRRDLVIGEVMLGRPDPVEAERDRALRSAASRWPRPRGREARRPQFWKVRLSPTCTAHRPRSQELARAFAQQPARAAPAARTLSVGEDLGADQRRRAARERRSARSRPVEPPSPGSGVRAATRKRGPRALPAARPRAGPRTSSSDGTAREELRVGARAEEMPAVEHEAAVLAVGAAHDLAGAAEIGDAGAGDELEPDPQAAFGGTVAEHRERARSPCAGSTSSSIEGEGA